MRQRLACFFVCLWLLPGASAHLALADEPTALRLDVPFVQQEKDGCGSASIAMVMQYWERQMGKPIAADATEIHRELYSRQAHGIYASDLKRYFADHDYRAFAFAGTWDDLQEQIAKGRPVIVALQVGRSDLHYVVIAGLDSRQNLLLKNDPAERKFLTQGRESFEKEWKAAANWMLLAVPQPDSSSSSR